MSTSSIYDLAHRNLYQLLLSWDIPRQEAKVLNVIALILITLTLSWLLNISSNYLITKSLSKASKNKFKDFFIALIENKVIRYTAHLIPLIVFYNAVPSIFKHFRDLIPFSLKFANVFIIWIGANIFKKIFRSFTDIAETKPGLRDKPLESYAQVVSLLLNFIAIVLIFSQITGQQVASFFTAMGAMSAVLMLIFKDTILGFVASLQITTNDMVRIGDWVEMSKYGADGDVVEISLTTVKIQNFDKTITTIPTYSLISDSFKNWRGMKNAGGRRIKRSINIKMSSVKFLDEEKLNKFQNIELIRPYLKQIQTDIDDYNANHQVDKSLAINGKNQTNLGLFRQYLNVYIQRNPDVRHDMTMMVRQLAPTEKGMPLEVYVFANTTIWAEYETIMADIFDHIIASAPYFELEIFESPSSFNIIYENKTVSPGSVI